MPSRSRRGRASPQRLSSGEVERLLELLRTEGRRRILTHWRADSCIASTRIAVEVLRARGVTAQPMSVRTYICNAAMHERMLREQRWPAPGELHQWGDEDGSWGVGLGFPADGYDPARSPWAGHLVVGVQRRWVLDLSLDQAARPQRGVHLEPAVFRARPAFFAAEQSEHVTVGGSWLVYQPVLDDRGFMTAPDWTDLQRHRPFIRELLAQR